MASVARGRAGRDDETEDGAAEEVSGARPVVVDERRQRALTAVLDVARFGLTALVRTVSDRLTTRASSVSLALVETEVRDAMRALDHAVLSEVVRRRGTGYQGPSYICPCGVRLVFDSSSRKSRRSSSGPGVARSS